jgi:hypothetical protein
LDTPIGKTAPIHRLLAAVADAHGPDAFPVEDWRPECPGAVGLTSARDRRFLASVVALPGPADRYAVMVELYDPPGAQILPCEIAADGEFDLAEVVELLGHYRDWCRA